VQSPQKEYSAMNKRNKLILHVGIPKTGTTSIQNFLADNPVFLANHGFIYPKTGQVQNMHLDLCLKLTEEIRSSLKKEIHKAGQKTVIMSSEIFWGSLNPPVASWLSEHFETTVIIFIRRQDKWIESVWRQLLKDSNYRKSSDLTDPLKLSEASWLHEWDARIRQFKEWFGEDSVHVRLYDETKNSVSEFLNLIGIDNTEGAFTPQRLNKTMHPTWVQFLRLARKIPWDQHQLSSLVQMLQELPGPQIEGPPMRLLSPEASFNIMKRCRTCNEWIAENHLTRQEGEVLLENVENPDFVTEEATFSDEAIALLFSGMWKTFWTQGIARLFWDTGNGFSHTQSAHKKVGERYDDLVFDLPVTAPILRIRFDPANVPISIHLNYLQTISYKGANSVLSLESSNANYVDNKTFCFAHKNPSMIFMLPGYDIISRVRISVTYLKFGSDVKVDYLERKIDDLQAQLTKKQ